MALDPVDPLATPASRRPTRLQSRRRRPVAPRRRVVAGPRGRVDADPDRAAAGGPIRNSCRRCCPGIDATRSAGPARWSLSGPLAAWLVEQLPSLDLAHGRSFPKLSPNASPADAFRTNFGKEGESIAGDVAGASDTARTRRPDRRSGCRCGGDPAGGDRRRVARYRPPQRDDQPARSRPPGRARRDRVGTLGHRTCLRAARVGGRPGRSGPNPLVDARRIDAAVAAAHDVDADGAGRTDGRSVGSDPMSTRPSRDADAPVEAVADILRPHAEDLYAGELAALAAIDERPRPPGWLLSPWAVVRYILGGRVAGYRHRHQPEVRRSAAPDRDRRRHARHRSGPAAARCAGHGEDVGERASGGGDQR